MSKRLDRGQLIGFAGRENGCDLPQRGERIDKEAVDEVDPGLSPEDQRFIRHYLAYADILLRAQPGKVIEMRGRGGDRKKKAA